MTDKEKKLYQDRLNKLKKIKELGKNPYPAKAKRDIHIQQLLEKFDELENSQESVALVGRIRAIREHGKLIFGNLEDESGGLQFLLRQDEIGDKRFETFQETMDIGDFVQVHGVPMKTKKGEQTLLISEYKILTKSLRALPEKWHGLSDKEIRLRKRYLDMLANPGVREMFRQKAVFWKTIRDFLEERGFLEVQTPALEHVTGGAEATPFQTHHNALDEDFYLRISLELPLKRLLVGGFEKVFEIGRLFRNEGIDREHLQEYDDMEFYWAYADWEDGMELTEKMFKKTTEEVMGTTKTKHGDVELDWGRKWPKVDYVDEFKKETGLDLAAGPDKADLQKKADELGIEYKKTDGVGRLIDSIYKKTVRQKLIQPCFLVGHPKAVSPLAKSIADQPEKVQRFQIVAAGTELGNGYSELNDPLDQKQRFEEQAKLRKQGDHEALMMDESFIEALEYGMPPAVGFGVSERLFAVLMDKSIRETVIFPLMKKKDDNE